uniref:PX domain-containing protein n=1 Tax=Schizophyllum commune (strain H4-8 / FGSC 9210) TaxID=578458 RepID=D8PNW8_SCHCM
MQRTASASSSTTTSPPPRRPTRSLPPAPLSLDDSPILDTTVVNASPTSETPQATTAVAPDGDDDKPATPGPADLTPLRAHYLKKTLVSVAFHSELQAITAQSPNISTSTFSYLGPPFSPPPKGAPSLDLPLLRYMFRQFVLTFPFMAAAPKDFYSDKLQPFMASVLSRNLSPVSPFDDGAENNEQATRQKLLAKLERNLSLFVTSALKLAEREEVVRLTQADLDRLEALSRKRQARNMRKRDIFEVNIVGVRTVQDRGRLRKAHPDQDVRSPPAKDRTTVSAPTQSAVQPGDSDYDLSSPPASPRNPSRLAREKNRLTLRAYLHSLMASSVIASSPVIKSFLLSGPIRLTPAELEDARRREDADRTRDDGRKKFAKEIADRVDGLRGAVKGVKGDIMGRDGLTRIFSTIKVTSDVRELPSEYRAVIEWARISSFSLASTVFHQFVASDDASEKFANLKRLHGLMPYFMMKTALKISNPVSMIRSIMDLFLAQPFGGRSLLQRMFSSSLSEEARQIEEEIEAVKAKVDDPVICEKVRRFVYAPKEIQDIHRQDAAEEKQELMTVVLRSGEEPVLNRMQMHRVAKASRAYAAYQKYRENLDDSDDDDGPQDEDGWLYEDLKILAFLYTRLQDREELIGLIFEGFTSELLKDIITIFYSPLAQVYRAASIGDSLSDLQNFINDLIRTVESVEESFETIVDRSAVSQEDPHTTVQAFIDLIQRHEQSFYNFVHKVHSKGEGLFDSLIRWIELFLTLVREGMGPPISLEFLLPASEKDRVDILSEVDAMAAYHYKTKVVYEDKLRRRFGRAQAGRSGEEAEEQTQAMVDGVLSEISFGEVIQGDADELAAADAEDSDWDSGSSDEYDSEEEDTSSEEDTETDEASTQESAAERRGTITRSSTVHALPSQQSVPYAVRSPQPRSRASMHTPVRSPHPDRREDKERTPRPRSLSLKLSRSMQDLKDALSSKKHDNLPPVPPLPQGISRTPTRPSYESRTPMSAASSFQTAVMKPLPPSPSQSSIGSTSSSRPPSSPSKGKLKKRMQSPLSPARSPMRSSQASLSSQSRPSSSLSSAASSVMEPPRSAPAAAANQTHRRGPSRGQTPKKNAAPSLKPPELQHIPKLVPVFIEMLRPHLRPRARTNPMA